MIHVWQPDTKNNSSRVVAQTCLVLSLHGLGTFTPAALLECCFPPTPPAPPRCLPHQVLASLMTTAAPAPSHPRPLALHHGSVDVLLAAAQLCPTPLLPLGDPRHRTALAWTCFPGHLIGMTVVAGAWLELTGISGAAGRALAHKATASLQGGPCGSASASLLCTCRCRPWRWGNAVPP